MSEQRKDEDLLFTVATVWREERVSCPHPDILHAYLTKSLDADAGAFVAFHLDESQCPYCNAVALDLKSEADSSTGAAAGSDGVTEDALNASRSRILRSTVSALRQAGNESE